MSTAEAPYVVLGIVETLRRRGPLPIGYLAKLFWRMPAEIEPDLKRLAEVGVLQITEKDGERFAELTEKGR